MPSLPAVAPGNTRKYTAVTVPPTSVPQAPPTWTSSNPKYAPVTASENGLVGTVVISKEAPIGTVFVLAISYTNQDGSLSTGTISETVIASPDIQSFTIEPTV